MGYGLLHFEKFLILQQGIIGHALAYVRLFANGSLLEMHGLSRGVYWVQRTWNNGLMLGVHGSGSTFVEARVYD